MEGAIKMQNNNLMAVTIRKHSTWFSLQYFATSREGVSTNLFKYGSCNNGLCKKAWLSFLHPFLVLCD